MTVRFGPYEVVSEIGRGGMGVVHEARSPDGTAVAVKVLRRDPVLGTLGGGSLAQFERERRMLAALGEAEGFVPLLDAGEVKGEPYVVMPFLGGGTLKDRLRRGPLPVDKAIALGIALARSLGRAHERGIVHRDLKPANVLFAFAGDPRPLVADLGLAKHFRDDAPGASQSVSLSKAGGFRGTPGAMPPEQMRDAKAAGPPADVFALGTIIYECVAGAAPFEGDNLLVLLENVERGRFEPLVSRVPAAPAWLGKVVARALAREPEARFADGHALAVALETEGRGEPALSRAGARVGAAVGLALGLAVGAGALVVARRRPAPAPSGLPVASPTASSSPASSPVVSPRASGPTGSPTSSTGASPAPGPSPGAVSSPAAPAGNAVLAPAVAARARALVESAIAHLAHGEDVEAARDATAALELDPFDAWALTTRGQAERRRHDYKAALADQNQALAFDPELAIAYARRGDIKVKLKDLDGAVADMRRASQLDPKTSYGHFVAAQVMFNRNEAPTALLELARALELDPANLDAWLVRGSFRRSTGDLAGAISDMTHALALAGADTNALLVRGLARRDSGDSTGAIADFSKGIELAPTPLLWWKRGELYQKVGDLEKAETDLARAVELYGQQDPSGVSAANELASVRKGLGR